MRLEYDVPEGCPDAPSFIRSVRTRTQSGLFSADVKPARRFKVSITIEKHGLLGRIAFRDDDGKQVSRTVRGETCDEVVSGLALIAALSLDARTEPPETDDIQTNADEAPAPQPAHPAPPQASTEDHRTPRAVAQKTPPTLELRAGLGGGINSWLGPSAAYGGDAFVEVSSPHSGAGGRFGLHGYEARGSDTIGSARFNTLFARLDACPYGIVSLGNWHMLPCIGVDVGLMRAQGLESEQVVETETQAIFWSNAVLLWRTRWDLHESWALGAQAELGVPLVRHDFVFEQPDRLAFRIPRAGAAVSVDMAVRF